LEIIALLQPVRTSQASRSRTIDASSGDTDDLKAQIARLLELVARPAIARERERAERVMLVVDPGGGPTPWSTAAASRGPVRRKEGAQQLRELTVVQVRCLLERIKFPEVGKAAETNGIDGRELEHLTEAELLDELGMTVARRRRMLLADITYIMQLWRTARPSSRCHHLAIEC
jgi:hypothetical protein